MAENSGQVEALGRANKTEAIQVRVDPKRRFVLEMIARRFSRSLASLIEEVVEQGLVKKQSAIVQDAEAAWSPVVSQRFVNQARYFPDTLTDMENLLWARIRREDKYWFGSNVKPRAKPSDRSFDFDALEEDWGRLVSSISDDKELQLFHEKMKVQLNAKGKQ